MYGDIRNGTGIPLNNFNISLNSRFINTQIFSLILVYIKLIHQIIILMKLMLKTSVSNFYNFYNFI